VSAHPGRAARNADIVALAAANEIGVYARQPVAFVRGRGCELWDADGRRYLDFFAGLAVTNLGHCHPTIVRAIQAQAERLLHVSNHYHTVPATELTALLCRHSFAERVFLCNSGAEANEAAIKATRWNKPTRKRLIGYIGAFHGRTMGALSLTHHEAYRLPFAPLLPPPHSAPQPCRRLAPCRVCWTTLLASGTISSPRPSPAPP